MNRPPVAALIIFDGWGLREAREANAILAARTPVMTRLWATQAHCAIEASGEAVGLAPGVMGNSEVGHLTIGAGRVIYQDVMRITKAIETGAFFRNEALVSACRAAAAGGRTLHLWGLLSDGSVHSHIDHLLALLDLAAHEKVENIAVHAALDGRDKPPRSALPFVDRLEAKLKEIGRGRIATVSGRYFAMDRDKRWDRVERAWRAIVMGEGRRAPTARAAVEAAYAENKGDEFVEPTVIGEAHPMADGDQVVCFNFRADRARELTAALTQDDFNGFARPRFPKIGYVCMSEYDRNFALPLAFGPEDVRNTLAEVLARAGIRNLRIARNRASAADAFPRRRTPRDARNASHRRADAGIVAFANDQLVYRGIRRGRDWMRRDAARGRRRGRGGFSGRNRRAPRAGMRPRHDRVIRGAVRASARGRIADSAGGGIANHGHGRRQGTGRAAQRRRRGRSGGRTARRGARARDQRIRDD
ncbi:2,3-bisphosphoglycerate-independent phosphoglycerate mutase [bacterium]|nr:2,3-bisphosphoglycerate-independent phosphoglycerate mutase [bacterium]